MIYSNCIQNLLYYFMILKMKSAEKYLRIYFLVCYLKLM